MNSEVVSQIGKHKHPTFRTLPVLALLAFAPHFLISAAASSPKAFSMPDVVTLSSPACGEGEFVAKIESFGPRHDTVKVLRGNGICSKGETVRLSTYSIISNGRIVTTRIKGLSSGVSPVRKTPRAESAGNMEPSARQVRTVAASGAEGKRRKRERRARKGGDYIIFRDGVDPAFFDGMNSGEIVDRSY